MPNPDIARAFPNLDARDYSITSGKTPSNNFIKLFETAGGYKKCGDASLEEGQEKVAIYQTSAKEFSHVARQKENGIWTSKLGKLHDVDHVDPFVLEKDYGPIAQFLKRPR
jgi:hypothetical protein